MTTCPNHNIELTLYLTQPLIMKTLKKSLLIIIATSAMITSQTHAAQWCSSKVSNVFLNTDGQVLAFFSARGDYLSACNVNVVWKGVTPVTCAKWLTLIHSAVARNADMIWYYNEDTACNAIASYGNAPAPGYIMLTN